MNHKNILLSLFFCVMALQAGYIAFLLAGPISWTGQYNTVASPAPPDPAPTPCALRHKAPDPDDPDANIYQLFPDGSWVRVENATYQVSGIEGAVLVYADGQLEYPASSFSMLRYNPPAEYYKFHYNPNQL